MAPPSDPAIIQRQDKQIEQGDEIGVPSTIQLAWSGEIVSLGGTVRSDGIVDA